MQSFSELALTKSENNLLLCQSSDDSSDSPSQITAAGENSQELHSMPSLIEPSKA